MFLLIRRGRQLRAAGNPRGKRRQGGRRGRRARAGPANKPEPGGPRPRLIVVAHDANPGDPDNPSRSEGLANAPLIAGDAALVGSHRRLRAVATLAATRGGRSGLILFTSGSTGQPKGVMLSHANAFTFLDWCRAHAGPVDRRRPVCLACPFPFRPVGFRPLRGLPERGDPGLDR